MDNIYLSVSYITEEGVFIMNIKLKICCITSIFYLLTQTTISESMLEDLDEYQSLVSIRQSIKSSENSPSVKTEENIKNNTDEKRASPAYDTIIGKDGLPHYRVLFWVPKEAKMFTPYSDEGVNTNVSTHGPVEKWSVQETKITNDKEKLVFIFVPKTFVYLYGSEFDKVIHLKYS